MSFSRTVLIDLVSRLGRAVISLTVVAVFVRELGINRFGTFVLFEAVLIVAGIFADLGIGSAVQKRVSEHHTSRVVSTALTLKSGLVLAVAVIIFLFRVEINSYLGEPLALYIPAAVGLQQLGRVGLHALRGDLRVSDASVIQFAGDGALLIIGYWFVTQGFGILSLVYGFLGGWSLILVWSLVRLGYSPTLPSRKAADSILDFSRYSFVSSVVGGALYSWMDTIVIGYFLSPGAVGLYETAWRISRAVSLLSQSVGTALFPQVSDWHLNGSLERIRGVIKNSLTVSLSVVFPAIIGGIIFGTQLLTVTFGAETSAAVIPLIVLLFGKLFEAANDVIGRVLYGLNLPRYTAYSALLFMVVNLGLNVFLVPRIGITGAAIATSLAFSANAGLNAYFLKLNLDFRPEWKDIGYCALASAGMGVGLIILSQFITVNSVLTLAVVVATGVVLYSLGLLVPASTRGHLRDLIRILHR